MINETKRNVQLEILIATMNRTNFDFLKSMFSKNDFTDLHLLIINQTSPGTELVSTHDNIRVINSYEKGISKSRNLAIANAQGKYCLITDDDVLFETKFYERIISGHQNLNAEIITFQTRTTKGRPYWSYPQNGDLSKSLLSKVLSIEISFKREQIQKAQITFNELFGLGAEFEDSESYLFLREALLERNLTGKHIPEVIAVHPEVSSSDDVTSDRYIHARAALNYKLYGRFSYFYVFKLLFSLFRKGLIKFNEIAPKYKVAQKSIKRYRSLQYAN